MDLADLILVDDRYRVWLFPDGQVRPYVAGGDGPEGEDGGSQEEGSGEDGGSEDEGSGEGSGGEKLSMTQAELDALIDKRMGRAKTKWESDVKAAGDRAKLDETERLKAEKDDAEKAAGERVATAHGRLVKSEAKSAALAAGVKADRVARFLRNVDLDDVDVDDDGTIDDKAIAAAVKAALDEVPEFAGTAGKPGASGADFGAGGDNPKPKTLEEAVNAAYATT